MPDIYTGGLDLNPSSNPIVYPGSPVTGSCLLVDNWIYELGSISGKPVAEWSTNIDGGPLAEGAAGERLRLDDALRCIGAAPMADRTPVLAIGSNAAPGQLRHKFPEGPIVPLIRATVRGLAVGHSAHVSKAGYVPYAPMADPSKEVARRFSLLWLDQEQVAIVDKTEPNYRRVVIKAPQVLVELESGERLARVQMYRGCWGILQSSPSGPVLQAMSQTELFRILGNQEWFVRVVPESRKGVEFAIRALADARRRDEIRREMARLGLAVDDGL